MKECRIKENKPASSGGFTLPEVLIAVAILAIGIVTVLEAFNVSLSALGESRNVLRADMLIMEKLAEIELAAGSKEGGAADSSNGSFAGEDSDFRWESRVNRISSLLTQVDLTVWREGSKRKYSVSTVLGGKGE